MNQLATSFFCVGLQVVDCVIIDPMGNFSLWLIQHECVYLSENDGS